MFTDKTALRSSLALFVVLSTILVSGTAAQGQAGNRFVDDDGNIHEGLSPTAVTKAASARTSP